MKIKTIKFALLLTFGVLAMVSCKKGHDHNDEELITTVTLKFTPTTGGATVPFVYEDLDGPGGNPPTKQTITLQPSKSYNVSIEFTDKSKNPAKDVTAEVNAEAKSHRVYYLPTISSLVVSNLNNDPNGLPLGLTSTWTTGAAANGKVRVVLRHYTGNPPNKAAADPVDSPKSSSDIDVEFDVSVQ